MVKVFISQNGPDFMTSAWFEWLNYSIQIYKDTKTAWNGNIN